MIESPAVPAPVLTVDAVTDPAAWAALAPRWDELAAESRFRPFLSYGWFAAAWEWRRADGELAVFAVRRGPTLVGVLPLIRLRGAHGTSRTLAALTVPDTQCYDIVAPPADGGSVAEAIAASLRARRDWDELRLGYLAEDGIIARALLPALREQGMCHLAGAASSNAYVPLEGTWSEFYTTRSRSLKKANNLAANRLAKAGTVRIEHYAAGSADPARRDRMLATTIDISARSWKRTTGNALDQPGPQAFVRALTDSADRRGEVALWIALLDERPVAMEYQLVAAGGVYALRADFDSGCVEISPGSHLFRHLLERQFGAGLTRYYMGPGDNPYKARWTEHGEPLAQATLFNRTLRGTLAWQWERRVKPWLRTLRDRALRLRRAGREGAPASAAAAGRHPPSIPG